MSKIIFTEIATKPPAPSVGQVSLYVKTDEVVYIQDSAGIETPLGTSSGITALTGDVSAMGPGSAVATVNFVGGASAANIASAVTLFLTATSTNTPSTLVLRDSSGNFSAGTITASLNGNAATATNTANFSGSLLGDVTGVQTATVVSFVGGQTAAAVASGVIAANAATPTNTASTIVERNASGNFSAGTITATFLGNLTGNVTGNVSGSSATFTGSLSGDVTGTQSATVVSFVGGSSAANIHSAELAANAATATNTASTIVKRDASGNFAANLITSNLNGNATTATSSGSFSGSLAGDVTGTQGATVVSFVDSFSAAAVGTSVLATQNATSSNTTSAIVERDASGNFSASTITSALVGSVTGNVTGNVSGSSATFTGSLTGDVTGVQGATVVSFVGGQTSSAIASGVIAANNATPSNAASTLVERDASGNFSAGTITAALVGNASTATSAVSATTAVNFTGSLSGDVTGTQSATAIASTVVTSKLLTGLVPGTNTAILSTDSILIALEKLQAQVNGTSGSAITQLTGDVTAIGPGSAVSTIAAIQGTTVTGVTGTGNVVFSASPTLTGTLSGAAANFSGAVSASNFTGSSSGTNTGNVTVTNTNSIDLAFTSAQTGLNATLNLSAAGPDAGYIPAVSEIKSDGLLVEVLAGTPVQIGTSNNIGSAPSAARSDHVHALTSATALGLLLSGYVAGTNTPINSSNTLLQGFENLQAQISATSGSAITQLTGDVTATGPGASASTVVALQGSAISSTVPTNAQILLWVNSTSKWTPSSVSGDATLANTGAITLSTVNSNVGSFSIANITVNAKGLVTAASSSTATGSGSVVLATSPTLVTPALGTPSSGIATNITGLPLTTGVTGVLPIVNGGTGQTTAKAARGSSGLNIDQQTNVVDTNYTALSTDRVIAYTSITASRVVTLPAASSTNAGQLLVIADESGSVSTSIIITITAAGSDVIDGAATKTIRGPYGRVILYSNGSNYWSKGVIGIGGGGTGLNTLPTNGQLLIGSTTNSNYVLSTLTAGTGITITNAPGSITVASPGPNITLTTTGVTGTAATLTGTVLNIPTPVDTRIQSIGISIDGGGSPITTGSKGFLHVEYNCTILGNTILADQVGSCVLAIASGSYGSFPTNSSIVASAPPTLTSAQSSQDNTLTGWTTTLTAGAVLQFSVTSASTVTRVNFNLRVQRTP